MKPLEHQIYEYVLHIAFQSGLVDVYATVAHFVEVEPDFDPKQLQEKIETAVVSLNAHAVWMPCTVAAPIDEWNGRATVFPSTISWYIH